MSVRIFSIIAGTRGWQFEWLNCKWKVVVIRIIYQEPKQKWTKDGSLEKDWKFKNTLTCDIYSSECTLCCSMEAPEDKLPLQMCTAQSWQSGSMSRSAPSPHWPRSSTCPPCSLPALGWCSLWGLGTGRSPGSTPPIWKINVKWYDLNLGQFYLSTLLSVLANTSL